MARISARTIPSFPGIRIVHLCAAAVCAGMLTAPASALAQSDNWQVDLAPLYFWASEIDGRLGVNSRSVPVFMSFADAADNLAGAFTFHGEARKGRWGVLGDVNFLRLSTSSSFTTPIQSRPVEGDADLDMTIFEVGASYLLHSERHFSVIGGLRTYTLSPKLEFVGVGGALTPVDESRTSANVFGGFTFRPVLSEKWAFLSRADVGAGQANVTWTGTVALEYRLKPWVGLMVGYHALGIDTGEVSEVPATGTAVETEYDFTHYGPVFALTFHLPKK